MPIEERLPVWSHVFDLQSHVGQANKVPAERAQAQIAEAGERRSGAVRKSLMGSNDAVQGWHAGTDWDVIYHPSARDSPQGSFFSVLHSHGSTTSV